MPLQSHSSQIFHKYSKNKKIAFALHPSEQIMATGGDDACIMIFDLSTDKLILKKYFEDVPTQLKFSPETPDYPSLLIIGFVNGSLYIFQISLKNSYF